MCDNKYYSQEAAYEILNLKTGKTRRGSIKGMKLTLEDHFALSCGKEVIYFDLRIRHARWRLLAKQATFLYKLKPTGDYHGAGSSN